MTNMLQKILMFSTYVCFVRSNDFGPKYPPTKGEVWPKPKSQKSENVVYTVQTDHFKVYVTGQTCDLLINAIKRYFLYVEESQALITKGYAEVDADKLMSLEVNVKQPCDEYPYFGMDESYDLIVEPAVKLDSSSVWGAIRGLETFSQLFYVTDDEMEIRINKSVINDAPRYPHRGLLIDTSRHYISLDNILKTIDALSMNKMNVLHWHIVDDQSFPYQSEKYPNLSRLGAYHSSLVYTKDDIKTVVNYARDRGVRVIPEIDVPGHTRSWGEAHPEILSNCCRDGKFIDFGPMNPIMNVTYELLRELFAEVQDWFPDKYFHIGGDEVDLNCWTSDPTIKQYMEDHDIKSAEQLHAIFMEKAIPLLDRESIPIVWQEVLDEKVPLSKNTLIQVWKDGWVEEMKRVLDSGYKVLFSAAWYLSVLNSGGDWAKFYKADPRDMVKDYFTGDNTYVLENIVGGEACMWGETVDDANIISRVWPRASAVAEKLWSPETPTDDIPLEVLYRLEEHTCRMNRRGIKAQPPNGPGFCVGVA